MLTYDVALKRAEASVKWWQDAIAIHDDCVASLCLCKAEKRRMDRERANMVTALRKRELARDRLLAEVRS